MGFGDPDHHHPLDVVHLKEDVDCFRCELPIFFRRSFGCYGCTRCNHFVHRLCLGLPQNMTHPLHPQHSLTLFPSSIPSSSQIIPENCTQCLQPFVASGYAYHCLSCLTFSLHLKCFITLNLEKKHHHPFRLCQPYSSMDCFICGILNDSETYYFHCDCDTFIHFECIFLPPRVKHRHVHELTFEYNYPEGCKVVDCDVCLDGKELDRTLSYYYCEKCDYIAHVRCVTSQPAKFATQFDHFIHEHPMLVLVNPDHKKLSCAACKHHDCYDSLYFCSICNYALHKSCAQFPRFMKHPSHEENHTLSLQSYASQKKDRKIVCCEFCTIELPDKGWIFQCLDCEFAIHLSCARQFKHPLYENGIFSFSSYNETKFRCNACGELGDGFRMSRRECKYHFPQDDLNLERFGLRGQIHGCHSHGKLGDGCRIMSRREYEYPLPQDDLHLECFGLPGQIEHACHSHPLYLVNSPAEIESYLSSVYECDICHTEADPDFWVYCCIQCKYIAHLKCVVSDLLPAPGCSRDFSNFCSIAMSEKEKFRVRQPKLHDCSEFLKNKQSYDPLPPLFLPHGFFPNLKSLIGDQNVRSVTDSDKSSMDVLFCPKCEKQISVQAYSSVWDWVHCNLKASMYSIQIQTLADHESLALLDEKIVDELHCPICSLLIFPPTYSCADCQIFFHKSCAELPRKYTLDGGHTLVLQSASMKSHSLSSNCSLCQRPCKGYAYFCTSCEVGFDVTCALGAPLLKLENQKHSFYVTTSRDGELIPNCWACQHSHPKGNTYFKCGVSKCKYNLHIECALLPRVVKHRIHQHSLVLEPHLDLSVDDYICDACEEKLNPLVWAYRCSNSCGDRATSHVSCIVTSNKKFHFAYDEECSYPHLDKNLIMVAIRYHSPNKKRTIPDFAAAIANKPPREKYMLVSKKLLSCVDELEHEYAHPVTEELMKMGQAEVLHLMESPDTLRAKITELMKDLTPALANAIPKSHADEDGL